MAQFIYMMNNSWSAARMALTELKIFDVEANKSFIKHK
jgi:hypothetical protein